MLRRTASVTVAISLAACGGGSGNTGPQSDPVTAVTLHGPARVKRDDSYQFTLTQQTASGDTVTHAVTWSSHQGPVTSGGLFTPDATGTIILTATVDGRQWNTTLAGYDWQSFSSATVVGTALASDTAVTNVHGQTSYPTLEFGCVSGDFLALVAFTGIVTANGGVAWSVDESGPVNQAWIEVPPNYNVLGYPGSTNSSQYGFATLLGNSHKFHFAFNEFQNGAHATTWRVVDLMTAIQPAWNACANSLVATASPVLHRQHARQLLAALATAAAPVPALQRAGGDRY